MVIADPAELTEPSWLDDSLPPDPEDSGVMYLADYLDG